MKKTVLFLFCIVFIFTLINIPNILAICEDNQVDINSASLEELDELSGIGPVKAQAIIDSRPFSRLDNLIDVVGIGEVTLANIKQQGLACVEGEEENQETQEEEQEDNEEETKKDEVEEEKEIKEIKIESNLQNTQEITEEQVKTIFLTPKSIKTENNNEQLGKNKFAVYGLIVLSISLVFLFVSKKRQNEKSEFR